MNRSHPQGQESPPENQAQYHTSMNITSNKKTQKDNLSFEHVSVSKNYK